MFLASIIRFFLDRLSGDEVGDQSPITSTTTSGIVDDIGLRDSFSDQDSLINFTSSSVEASLDPTNVLFNMTLTLADHFFNSTSNHHQNQRVNSVTGIPSLIKQETRHLTVTGQAFITVFYLLGIGGNVGALVLLTRGETVRNRKQTLMIRCLVWHDLLALVGSFVVMYMHLYLRPEWVVTRWFCALRVLLRTFGLSSGCVAIVMAVERWIALTRPFVYHKHVTLTRIRRAIFTLWLVVLVLVCLPFLGFGLYYDSEIATFLLSSSSAEYYKDKPRPQACVRYRFAKRSCDVTYAYLMFSFGILLSCVIVGCNLAVVRALCRMGRDCPARPRRACGRSSNTLSRSASHHSQSQATTSQNGVTNEEISFAKLMIVLSIFFVSGWVPQMVTIIMAQLLPENESNHPFYRIADVFMALNFTLDPVVYVLSRRPHRRGFRRVVKLLCRICCCCGCCCCWSPHDMRDGSLKSSTQAFLYKTNFISSNYRLHGGDKKLQLGDPGDELVSERRSSSSGGRVHSGGSGGSASRCNIGRDHMCCYHVPDRLVHGSNPSNGSREENVKNEPPESPIVFARKRFGRIRAPRLNLCGRSVPRDPCTSCQTCPTCPRACPGCCHFSCSSRRHQRPQRYRMKYPPDEGLPRHLRNCHSEGCGQQISSGHLCLRKYPNSCMNDDRPVVSDFVLETRSSLYFHT